MSNPTSNLADVEFIATQVHRYASLTPESLMQHLQRNRQDGFCTLPHPDDGEVIIGREAMERLWAIAARYLKANPEKKARVPFEEFVNALRLEFSRRFLKERRPIDQSNVDKMVSVAYKSVAHNFEELEHFIPVNLFMTKATQAFKIGPVLFVHKTEFLSRYRAELEAQRTIIAKKSHERAAALIEEGYSPSSVGSKEDAIALGNRLVDGLIAAFCEHSWFAIVTIPSCEASVSYEKAVFLTKAALNVLKLLLGGNYTDRLRTVEDQGHRSMGAKLCRSKAGDLEISISITPQDNIIGDQWLEILNTRFGDWLKMASDVLDCCRDLDAAPHLCVRFLDALAWYGDAIAERSTAPKIVKFVSAIERLVCTGKEHDENGEPLPLADIVIPRAGTLYADGLGIDLVQAQDVVKDIYEFRSNIVHGSISPFDEALPPVAVRAHEATRMILLGALDLFTWLGINDRNVSDKRLQENYLQIVSKKRASIAPTGPPSGASKA